jgi:hypothetical protein
MLLYTIIYNIYHIDNYKRLCMIIGYYRRLYMIIYVIIDDYICYIYTIMYDHILSCMIIYDYICYYRRLYMLYIRLCMIIYYHV